MTAHRNTSEGRALVQELRHGSRRGVCFACGRHTESFSTQEAVAEAVGWSQASVSRYERGLTDIDNAMFLRLLALFGLTLEEFNRMAAAIGSGSTPYQLVRNWRDRTDELHDTRRRGYGYDDRRRWGWGKLERVQQGWRRKSEVG